MAKIKRELQLHNERALYFIDFLVSHHLEKDESAVLKKIGYEHVNNIGQIKTGVRGFRMEHISLLCEKYNGDGNFFTLRKYNNMFRKEKNISELMQLKEAVAMVALKMAELSKPK